MMLKTVFSKSGDRKTLVFAGIGATIGLVLLMIAVQIYVDVYSIVQDKNKQNDYIVLKKGISTLNTLGLKSSKFTPDELDELSKQDFVSKVAPFKSGNGFEVLVILSFGSGNFPPFSTLAFFESLPDDFLDVQPKEWKWQEGNKEVPIILPNTFLDAYNYGIAPSMGAPQASKDLIKSVRFQLKISGDKGNALYFGKVVGFSDRVNSILVPDNFLCYLNKNYGNGDTEQFSRIIIATTNKQNPKIKTYLKSHNYETNNELIKENMMQQIALGLFSSLSFIGIVIVFLSVLNLLLYAQVSIAKNKIQIKILFLLGYKWQAIAKALLRQFVWVYGVVFLIASILLIVLKWFWSVWLQNIMSIHVSVFASIITFVVGLAFILLFLFLNYNNIKVQVKNLFEA